MEIFIENLLDIAQSSAKIDEFADFVSMLQYWMCKQKLQPRTDG